MRLATLTWICAAAFAWPPVPASGSPGYPAGAAEDFDYFAQEPTPATLPDEIPNPPTPPSSAMPEEEPPSSAAPQEEPPSPQAALNQALPTSPPLEHPLAELANNQAATTWDGYGADYSAGSTCVPCGPCEPCGAGPQTWVDVDYLLWWVEPMRLPPLVTSSPLGTPREEAGVLGFPTTTILVGGEDVHDDDRNGGRLRIGAWLDACQRWGVEANFFALEDEGLDFSAASDGDPALARPFFNVDPAVNDQDSALVAFTEVDPDSGPITVWTGDVSVRTSSDVTSAEVLARRTGGLWSNTWQISGLAGYRAFRLDEAIRIDQFQTFQDPRGPFPIGTTLDIFDLFDVENEFHGGVLGLGFRHEGCRVVCDGVVKIALGNTTSRVRIAGQTVVSDGETIVRPGGLLALPTNAGEHEISEFAVLPEVNFNVRVKVDAHWTLNVGYTFMYLSEVARAGDQIDLAVNGALLDPNIPDAGPARPAFGMETTNVWLQGLNLGMTFAY